MTVLEGRESGRVSLVWCLALAVTMAMMVQACGTSEGSAPADGEDAVHEDSHADVQRADELSLGACSGLAEGACSATEACMSLEAWPQPQACLVWADEPAGGHAQFVACVETQVCSLSFTWAQPGESGQEPWLFPSACTPAGWVKPDDPPCCRPDCDGRECGYDLCGSACGVCAEGFACVDGLCAAKVALGAPCDDDGDCPGSYCLAPVCTIPCLQSQDCPEGWRCGRLPNGGAPDIAFYCLPEVCQPACDGKECGDDGCGGACGTCSGGLTCEQGTCFPLGCTPNCYDKACGPDGCGGSCGVCSDGLECNDTGYGMQCTNACEPGGCSEGLFCLFGLCAERECEDDDDCGGAPAHYCDRFLQCRQRKACQATAECRTGSAEGYCDQVTGYCMRDGHCWDDDDCSGGTCDPGRWCRNHNCLHPDGPGCPPDQPLCDAPSGEAPLCEGEPCGVCIAPCVFDADCSEGLLCQGVGLCQAPPYYCDLDTECGAGQYCHPGCADLPPTCESEADCSENELCLSGFCMGELVIPCETDAECALLYEGTSCQGGLCKPVDHCLLDSQCGEGQHCFHTCQPLPDGPECKTDAGCPVDQICENEACQDPVECWFDVQCPAGHVCEEQHCYNDTGVCAWIEKGPAFCDDQDPCTTDSCDADAGCVHASGICD